MSFKTEYHVDVSFLHDLVTMGHTAKVQSTKAQSANNNKEKWANSRELSRITAQKRKAARNAWIANTQELQNYKKDVPMQEHTKLEFLTAATHCDLSSPVDTFKTMWNKLSYDKKTIIQGFLNTARASSDQDIKKPKISLALLNFINEDVFQTLLQCIVTEFNNEKFNPVYVKKLENLAMGSTLKERHAMKQIWENLNFRAQDRVIYYFQMRPGFDKQFKLCMDLKKDEEIRKKKEHDMNQTPESSNLNFQNDEDENGWARL